MTLVILVLILILLKFVVKLVDGIVSQVHIEIVQIRIVRWLIFLSSKSSYALLMNVYA